MKDQSCKTPRWKMLKAQLNNLLPETFMARMNTQENPIIIDVRTAEEFATGHIDQARNINYFADDFWEQLEQLDAGQPIFVYCRTGRRSIRACTLMRNGGFNNDLIFNLEGGYNLWLKEMSTNV